MADNMKDLRERLDKLRADAANLAVISRRASESIACTRTDDPGDVVAGEAA